MNTPGVAAPVMTAGGAAESAARHVRAADFRHLGGLGRWRGDVGEVFKRGLAPLAAEKVALGLRIKMIVRKRIPGAKRRVIVAHARHEEIVRVNVLLADGRPW